MGQPHEREPADPAEPTTSGKPAHGDEEATVPTPGRWTGSAAVPPPEEKRRRRRVHLEDTAELAAADEEAWPPPPPPRPANAPVTAPYPPPPPRPPAWTPPPLPPGRWPNTVAPYPPRYPRRRRRWPWLLATLVLLVVACCGCCISWFQPYAEEYPASASLPAEAAGLTKLEDPASLATRTELEIKVRSRHWLAEDVFAAVYAEPRTGQRPVVLFGATMFILSPDSGLTTALADFAGDLSLTDVRDVPVGKAGGYLRCGQGRAAGQGGRGGEAVTVCGWADHGSFAIAIFSGRSVEQSAGLLRDLRAAVITRK